MNGADMPSVKKVSSLLDLSTHGALRALLPVFLSGLQNQSRVQQIVRQCLPPRLLQHLLNAAILHYSERCMCTSLVATLCSETTTDLVFVDDRLDARLGLEDCMPFYMSLYKNQVFALQRLAFSVALNPRHDIKYLQFPNTFLYRPLENMTRLVSFVMKAGADDTVLSVLGKHCPQLSFVDVSGSWLVTDDGIRSLCWKSSEKRWADRERNSLCYQLEKCLIANTRVGIEGFAHLLFCCSNLRATGAAPNDGTMVDVLKILEDQNENFIHESFGELFVTSTKEDDWAWLERCLPSVTAISAPFRCFERITNFANIDTLIIDIDFHPICDDFYYYLDIIGASLRNLTLLNQTYPVYFQDLIKYCPKLETLEAYVESVESLEMTPTNLLRNVKVRFSSTETLRVLLRTSPELKNVELSFYHEEYEQTYEDINDELMTEILEGGSFVHLRNFYVESDCHLGAATLFKILDKCPNVQWVGDLHNWRKLDVKTIEQLGKAVRSSNWDLDVIYYFSLGR